MKNFLRGLILSGLLGIGSLVATPQVRLAEPAVVEYNFGFCGGESFTVNHAVLSENEKHEQQLDFNYHLEGNKDSATAVKSEGNERIIFSFKAEPKDKDNNIKYHAEAKFEEHKLVINGLIHGEYVIGILLVDGELGHVLYGRVGKVEDMIKVADQDFNFCADLHQLDSNDAIPKALARWLSDKVKSAEGSNKS